jgi:hypothetical protein
VVYYATNVHTVYINMLPNWFGYWVWHLVTGILADVTYDPTPRCFILDLCCDYAGDVTNSMIDAIDANCFLTVTPHPRSRIRRIRYSRWRPCCAQATPHAQMEHLEVNAMLMSTGCILRIQRGRRYGSLSCWSL